MKKWEKYFWLWMCVESGYAHFTLLTSYGLGKAGENARQACVFSPTSADGLIERHGNARVPFPLKRRKREKDNSVSNDEIYNRATTNELYWVGLRQIYSFRRLCKIAKSDHQRRDICLSACPTVRPYVSMEQLASQLIDFQDILEYTSKICRENTRMTDTLRDNQ